MNFKQWSLAAILIFSGLLGSCSNQSGSSSASQSNDSALVGQWQTKIQFTTGAFAAINDLEFMYTFNSGGTVNESSNYDVAPPVPPAYGIWKHTGPNQYEAKYQFFLTRVPADINELTRGSGWLPDGLGVLVEKITLSSDGNTYNSTVRYDAYDRQGKVLDGGGDATAQGVKLRF